MTGPSSDVVTTTPTLELIVAIGLAADRPADVAGDALDMRIQTFARRVGARSLQDRDEFPYRMVRWLMQDFGASPAVAHEYALQRAAGNVPQLTLRECAAVMQSVYRTRGVA